MSTELGLWSGEQRLGWSSLWLVDKIGSHVLVAVPRLRLSQEVVQDLASGRSYAQVFKGATVQVLADPPRPFSVIHATFMLYRTGEPDLNDFAVLVPNPVEPPPPAARVIARTAQMLRG